MEYILNGRFPRQQTKRAKLYFDLLQAKIIIISKSPLLQNIKKHKRDIRVTVFFFFLGLSKSKNPWNSKGLLTLNHTCGGGVVKALDSGYRGCGFKTRFILPLVSVLLQALLVDLCGCCCCYCYCRCCCCCCCCC